MSATKKYTESTHNTMKYNANMLQAQMGVIRVDFSTSMFCIGKNLQVALIETNPWEKI